MKRTPRRHVRERLLICAMVAVAGGRVAGMPQRPTPQEDRPSAAPQGNGDLRGIVKDEVGEALFGASVILTDQRQRTRRTTTDLTGAYAFHDVTPGLYQLDVSRAGFAPVTRSLEISPGGRLLVDVTVRVAIDQRIEVVASLDEFRRASGLTPFGLTLGAAELTTLPSDPDMMLAVLRELSASTGRADQVAVYVDGQPIASRLPPKEVIQSIRISTNSFASEFAEPSSGLVEIFTKPAATSFRGEYQTTFNDSRLNARNAFEPRKNPSRTQSYAGYLGGPIVPARWSFLGYGGRWLRDDRVVVNTTVADPATRTLQPFLRSVTTPDRVDSYSLRMDVMPAARHVVAFQYGRSVESQRNAGLDSGLDLPERGISRDAREGTARLSVVSSFSDGFGSELRLGVRRRTFQESALTFEPAVMVLDAFNAGGNQAALRQDSTITETSLSHILSYTDQGQSVRGGIQLDVLRQQQQRMTNTGGTFVFGALLDPAGNLVATPLERYLRTLQGIPGYGPSSFSIASGAPSIDFGDWQLSAFVQDDVQQAPNVTLSMGVRYDLQKHARLTLLNVAPRAGVAWTPSGDSNHTVRAAAGLFYSHVPPEITIDPMQYDGVKTVEFVVDQPPFFPTVPTPLDATAALPTVRLSHPVFAPITTAATASYEWHASRTLTASVGYTYQRGDRLLRTIDLNVADPFTGRLSQPDRGPVLEFESTGRSRTQELHVTVRHGLPPFSVFGTYVLRSAHSDTDGPFTIPADSRTLEGEYGRAGDDERHHVVFGSAINFPRDWSFSSLLTIGSGRPFNITTGVDNNGDLLFVDRPTAGAAGDPGAIPTRFGNFDSSGTVGVPLILRNAGQGPSQFVLNVGLAKTLRFGNTGGSRPYVIFSVNADNLTNRINYTEFNGVVTSPLFGTANRALNPRRVELAARFGF